MSTVSLQRRKNPSQGCLGYDIKISDGEDLRNVKYSIDITPRATVTRMVMPVKVLFMGERELFYHLSACKQITDVILLVLHSKT